MDFMTTALILAWVAILLLALVVSRLVHQLHQLSGRSRRQASLGLPSGSPVPVPLSTSVKHTLPNGPGSVPGRLIDPDTGTTLLLFLSAGCRTCVDVLHEVSAWAARTTEAEFAAAVLYAGPVPPEASEATVPVLSGQAELFAAYDVPATPFAVVVSDGRVARCEPLGSREKARLLLDELDASIGGGNDGGQGAGGHDAPEAGTSTQAGGTAPAGPSAQAEPPAQAERPTRAGPAPLAERAGRTA